MKRLIQIFRRPLNIETIAARQYAYAVDLILWKAGGLAIFKFSGLVESIGKAIEPTSFRILLFAMFVMYRVLFISKDGYSGFSPGKIVFGLRVVDSRTGAPIGPLRSCQRNLILLIPGVGELIVLFQMSLGRRWFDRWANCAVVELNDLDDMGAD